MRTILLACAVAIIAAAYCDKIRPSAIFDMMESDTVSIDMPIIPLKGTAEIDIPVLDAEPGDVFIISPLSSNSLQEDQPGICMDLECEVRVQGVVTVIAHSCASTIQDPPAATFMLLKSRK